MTQTRYGSLLTALFWLCAAAIFAVAVYFRVWHLGNIPGLNGDEAEYGAKAIDLLHGRAITWVTSNSSRQNLLYFLPIVALHTTFLPSIVLLRTVAVICGVLALVANYLLCRKTLNAATALFTTLVLAVLAENIIESRIGWDPCQSLLIDCFTIYFALGMAKHPDAARKYFIGSLIADGIGVTIHGPNVFALVFPIVSALIVWNTELRAFAREKRGRTFIAGSIVGCIAVAAGVVSLMPHLFANASALRYELAPAWILDYERLFSGATTYEYIAGYPILPYRASIADIVATLPWVFTLVWSIGIFRRWHGAELTDRIIATGWLVQLATFSLTMTGAAMMAGNERYALCLILPGVLAITRASQSVLERQTVTVKIAAIAAGLVLLAGGLAQFDSHIFGYIEATGGTYQDAFKTGPIDPKLAAWNIIRPQLAPSTTNFICTDSWWTYQPIRYFAATSANVVCVNQIPTDPVYRTEFSNQLKLGHVWFVEFRSNDPQSYRLSLLTLGIPCTVTTMYGYNHVPLVDVIHPGASSGS